MSSLAYIVRGSYTLISDEPTRLTMSTSSYTPPSLLDLRRIIIIQQIAYLPSRLQDAIVTFLTQMWQRIKSNVTMLWKL